MRGLVGSSPNDARYRDRCECGMVVREIGGTGPALVWVHGLGESGLCFEPVLGQPGLRPRRHLVPDLPGYGRSPWVPGSISLEALADHVAGWIVRSAGGPCVLVGHSMGGVLVQLVAERHPDVALGVVVIDGNVTAGDCTFSGRAVADRLDAFVASSWDRLRESVWQTGLDDPAHRSYWASLCRADPVAFHRHSGDLVRLSSAEDLALRLARLPVPTVYVAGVPGGACAASLRRLEEAGVTLHRIEPSGHWPFVDRPAEVAERLEGWLAEHRL